MAVVSYFILFCQLLTDNCKKKIKKCKAHLSLPFSKAGWAAAGMTSDCGNPPLGIPPGSSVLQLLIRNNARSAQAVAAEYGVKCLCRCWSPQGQVGTTRKGESFGGEGWWILSKVRKEEVGELAKILMDLMLVNFSMCFTWVLLS